MPKEGNYLTRLHVKPGHHSRYTTLVINFVLSTFLPLDFLSLVFIYHQQLVDEEILTDLREAMSTPMVDEDDSSAAVWPTAPKYNFTAPKRLTDFDASEVQSDVPGCFFRSARW